MNKHNIRKYLENKSKNSVLLIFFKVIESSFDIVDFFISFEKSIECMG